MKKYLDWLFFAFFIAGFVVGALKYSFNFPSWLLIIVGAIVSIIGGMIKKKIE